MEIRVHEKSVEKLEAMLKKITGRSNAMSMEFRSTKLRQVIIR
jgi:RNA-directed DNA polymerase